MNEWADSAKMAMDVLIACIIVVALLMCGQLAGQITSAMDKEQAVQQDVLAFRIANMYDNAECYSQDIVSLVIQYQGTPEVTVTRKDGVTLRWNSTQMSTQITSASISAVLNIKSVYKCTVLYDANGSLTSYNFQEV